MFDANAFIDLGERFYPADVFEGVWTELESALIGGRILTCKRVLVELARVGQPEPWRKVVHDACISLVIDESASEIQTVFGRLAVLASNRVISRRLSDVDLLVLSCAEARGLPVVTNDTKMISACNAGHVAAQHVTLTALFRQLGWKFPIAL